MTFDETPKHLLAPPADKPRRPHTPATCGDVAALEAAEALQAHPRWTQACRDAACEPIPLTTRAWCEEHRRYERVAVTQPGAVAWIYFQDAALELVGQLRRFDTSGCAQPYGSFDGPEPGRQLVHSRTIYAGEACGRPLKVTGFGATAHLAQVDCALKVARLVDELACQTREAA